MEETETIKLSKETVLVYAMNIYSGRIIDLSEFQEDFEKIKYIGKLLTRYKKNNILNLQLILNHIRVLYNVFTPPTACTRMIVFKLHDSLPQLKPILIQMGFWPEMIDGIEGLPIIYSHNIVSDPLIENELKKLIRPTY